MNYFQQNFTIQHGIIKKTRLVFPKIQPTFHKLIIPNQICKCYIYIRRRHKTKTCHLPPPPLLHLIHEGYNNEERSFKTVLVLDWPLHGWCLQQIAPSCHNNLKRFAPMLAIMYWSGVHNGVTSDKMEVWGNSTKEWNEGLNYWTLSIQIATPQDIWTECHSAYATTKLWY